MSEAREVRVVVSSSGPDPRDAGSAARFDDAAPAGAAARRELGGREDAVRRWLLYLVTLAAASVTVMTVRWPPVLDLPQQLDQTRLVGDVLSGTRADLEIRWLGANRLGYLPLALASALAPVEWAPRVSVVLLLAVGLGAIHLLSYLTRQTPATTLLASTLIFGSSFYAGFFNFLCGFVGLAFWTWELREERRRGSPVTIFLSTLAGALLLYLAHGLWFAVLGPVVASYVLLRGVDLRELMARAAGVLALLPLAFEFQSELSARGWQARGAMMISPWLRVTDLDVLASVAYGGLKGFVEPVLAVVLLGWIGLAAVAAFRDPRRIRSRFLVLAGLAFLALAFLGPFRVDQTILFAWRWGAPGFLALLMALPPLAPGVRPAILAAVALGLQLAVTGHAWRAFDRAEMRGFESCLAGIPVGSAVLGVDGDPTSEVLRLTPTLQMFAYAGFERSSPLAFSFAEYGSSLVVRREAGAVNLLGQWLLMNPAQLRPSHLDDYDFVLAHGPIGLAEDLERRTGRLRRIGGGERWHLLEVLPDGRGGQIDPGQGL